MSEEKFLRTGEISKMQCAAIWLQEAGMQSSLVASSLHSRAGTSGDVNLPSSASVSLSKGSFIVES